MAIDRLLKNLNVDPSREALMKTAFEKAVQTAKVGRNDPKADLIASRIVHAAQTGENNFHRIVDIALRDLRKPHRQGP